MRKVYVKPVMESEEFVTNAYCGACQANPILNNLIVDYKSNPSAWYGDYGYGAWRGDTNKFDTSHSFANSDRRQMRNPSNGQMQYYWVCNCSDHPGETYYLEHSAYWSQQQSARSGFVLFRETNGTRDLQPDPYNASFPDNNPGQYDTAIAVVRYSEEYVQNS